MKSIVKNYKEFILPIIIDFITMFFVNIIDNDLLFSLLLAFPIIPAGLFILMRSRPAFLSKLLYKNTYYYILIIMLFCIYYISLSTTIIISYYNINNIKLIVCMLILFLYINITCFIFLFFSHDIRTVKRKANVASCIPIEEKDNNILEVTLIRNKKHNNKWMFPGGHVNSSLQTPKDVAVKKAEIEAGLKVEVLDLKFLQEFDHCTNIIYPPHFVYSLDVTEEVECNRELGHTKHIDFVYICKVTKKTSNSGVYHTIKIEIDKNSKNDFTENAITNKITSKINEYYKSENNINQTDYHELSTDIPFRLLVALKAYLKYCN